MKNYFDLKFMANDAVFYVNAIQQYMNGLTTVIFCKKLSHDQQFPIKCLLKHRL